jgi:hypothetical protein
MKKNNKRKETKYISIWQKGLSKGAAKGKRQAGIGHL